MNVEVGTGLHYKGREYVCIAVEKIDLEEIAKEDSASIRNYYSITENVRVLSMEIDIFHAGDIIHRTGERITLECPGVDVSFIYTSVKIVKKESGSNGFNGSEDSNRKGSAGEAEGLGAGDSGGEGVGETGVG